MEEGGGRRVETEERWLGLSSSCTIRGEEIHERDERREEGPLILRVAYHHGRGAERPIERPRAPSY